MTDSPNGWNEWSKFVLKELERLNECYKEMNNKLDDLKSTTVALKVQMGFIGAVSAIIVSIIMKYALK